MTTTAGSFHPPLAKTIVAWLGAAAYLVMTACTEVLDAPEPQQADDFEEAHREFLRMWNLPLDKLLDIVERHQTVVRDRIEARRRGLSYNPPPATTGFDSVLKAALALQAKAFLMRAGNEAPPGRPADVVEEIGGWQVATWHNFESEAFLVVGIAMLGLPDLSLKVVMGGCEDGTTTYTTQGVRERDEDHSRFEAGGAIAVGLWRDLAAAEPPQADIGLGHLRIPELYDGYIRGSKVMASRIAAACGWEI